MATLAQDVVFSYREDHLRAWQTETFVKFVNLSFPDQMVKVIDDVLGMDLKSASATGRYPTEAKVQKLIDVVVGEDEMGRDEGVRFFVRMLLIAWRDVRIFQNNQSIARESLNKKLAGGQWPPEALGRAIEIFESRAVR